jgi:hypothetical protein
MDLVKKIKDKMIADGEYGEFFPVSMSPFPYEDTMAHDYFPESEKVISAPVGDYLTVDTLPDDSRDIDPVALSKNSYLCPVTGKLFRFQQKELEFYKNMFLPVPHESFEARYKRRNQLIPFPY